MGKGKEQEIELERELDELYRRVAGDEPREDAALSDAAMAKSRMRPGEGGEGVATELPVAERKGPSPRTPYLAAGLICTGLMLIGFGLYSWYVADSNQPLFRWTDFLRMAGWSERQTTYLTRQDGLRQPVPPEAVILNFEAATGPAAPAPPARDPFVSLEALPPIKKPVVPAEEPPAALNVPSVRPTGPLTSVGEPGPPAKEPPPPAGKPSPPAPEKVLPVRQSSPLAGRPSSPAKGPPSLGESSLPAGELSTGEIGKREERLRIYAAPKELRRGNYAVQIRAYPENRKREAMAFTDDVRKKESRVSMETVSIPGRGVWHRILIGDFPTAEEAAEYRESRQLTREYPYSFVQTKSGNRP